MLIKSHHQKNIHYYSVILLRPESIGRLTENEVTTLNALCEDLLLSPIDSSSESTNASLQLSAGQPVFTSTESNWARQNQAQWHNRYVCIRFRNWCNRLVLACEETEEEGAPRWSSTDAAVLCSIRSGPCCSCQPSTVCQSVGVVICSLARACTV